MDCLAGEVDCCDVLVCEPDPCEDVGLCGEPDPCDDFGLCGEPDACEDLGVCTEDADDDNVPDFIEAELCGRQIVRNTFENLDREAGHCETVTDYVPPTVGDPLGPLGPVFEAIDNVRDLVDEDRDNVPDALEPTICSIENSNSDLDGSCTGDDYHP